MSTRFFATLPITVAAFSTRTDTAPSQWALWVLCGVAAVLLVGIFLLARSLVQAKKQAASLQEKLSAAETRFQAFFHDPAVGIGILGLDRRLVDANPTFFRIFGRPREEMIGMNSAEVTYPDDDPTSAKLFMELLKGERDLYEADRRYIRKNGEIFWAHVTMSIVRGADNTPDYLVGVMMDVDKQKRDALALQESQARFQALFDNLAVGIAVTTLDGKPIAFNPVVEKITGYTVDDIQQLDSRLLVVPEDWEKGSKLFEELMEGKRRSYTDELRYRRKNAKAQKSLFGSLKIH
jgi:PAS domain S-box-containing protein